MLTIYNKLFTIKVKHDFYKDMISRDDIVFMPTRECREFMESNRLLFRRAADGSVSLLYKTNGQEGSTTPFIALDANKYVFALGLKDSARFFNVTNLESGTAKEQYTSGKLAYFRNSGSQSELVYELIDHLRPALFTYEFTFTAPAGATATGHLSVKDDDGSTVIDVTAISKQGNGIYKAPVDFRSLPKGKYTFYYSDASNPAISETVYVDNDLAGRDIFGVLVIDSSVETVLNDFLALSPFEMVFTRQETLWRYIIILKTGKVLASDILTITDILYDDTGSSYAEYTFVPEGETTVNGFPAFKFISVEPIPFFEEPKLDLKLKKTSGAVTTTIIDDLPNPASAGVIAGYAATDDRPVSEVFIYV